MNEWRLPAKTLNQIIQGDKDWAAAAYGPESALAKPHQFPCIAVATQKRRGTRCVVVVLGGIRNRQPTLVIDGPDGSDLPESSRGDDFSIGKVYTALSSASTRACGDSNSNGWMMHVENSSQTELRVIRPVENGCGIEGLTCSRLKWLGEMWEIVLAAAALNKTNKALQRLVEAHDDALSIFGSAPVPPEFSSVSREYAIWKGLVCKSAPNLDSKVRTRTRVHARQLKKTKRPREQRRAVGTSLPQDVRMIGYEGMVSINRSTNCLSVLSRADKGRRIKAWVPLTIVCERYRETILSSCIHDVIAALTEQRK